MSAVLDTERPVARWVPPDPMGRTLMAKFFRALGDPTRLGLAEFCAERERTGAECVSHAGLSQGRVSAHLGCKVSCGLLTLRRASRFAHYQVTDPRVLQLLRISQEMVAAQAVSIAVCTKVRPAR